jgi:hypothetical protein
MIPPGERGEGFLRMIQSLDEPTKQNVIVIATIIIMIIVIYFWLTYFNPIALSVATATPAIPGAMDAREATHSPSAGSSFFDRAKGGVAYMYGEFLGGVRTLQNILQTPRQYIINH